MMCPSAGSRWQPMAGSNTKLTPKQEQTILALLTQPNFEQTARAMGVGLRTLYRWLKEPAFEAEYRKARRAAVGQSVARLQQGTSAAATTLLKMMIDQNTPPSVRVRAAEAIFNHAAKAIEIEDIEARVSALEASVAGERAGGR